MKWFLLALSLWSSTAFGQSIPFPGPGGPASSGAAFTGPGDLGVGTIASFGSCAYVAQASLASTSTKLCDLVATGTTTPVICTLRGTTTGVVDANLCFDGVTVPTTICLGGCSVIKQYNQVNPGTLDEVQTGAANTIPTISFAALNSLPVLNFNSVFFLASNTPSSLTTPGFSSVAKRTTASAGGYISASNVLVEMRGAGSANNAALSCGSAVAVAAPDNQWNALNALCSGVANTSAMNVNGTLSSPLNAGTTAMSTSTIQIGKAEAGSAFGGQIAESILWSSTLTTANLQTICTNQKARYALTTGFTC